jgi:hypothetical protein
MTLRAVLLAELVALLVSLADAPTPAPRVLAVLKELDRISARPLWPGFEPSQVPVAIFEGGRTWLARHTTPPQGLQHWPDTRSVAVFEGAAPGLRANTAIGLAGVGTCASFEGALGGIRRLAGPRPRPSTSSRAAASKWGGNGWTS